MAERKIALLIGVNEYGEGIPPLSAPLNDVEALKEVLENPELVAFDEVRTLKNPDLTVMRWEIQKLFEDGGKQDIILLFFSGHGILDEDYHLYLSTRLTTEFQFESTSLEASFIQKHSRNSYCKRQIIILDCCYSGAFATGFQLKSFSNPSFKRELGSEGRVVLTSSTATRPSYIPDNEPLSLYTSFLIEGIKTGEADEDTDGKIYVHELHEYAKKKIQEIRPKDKPEIIIDDEGYNIFFSYAPNGSGSKIQQPGKEDLIHPAKRVSRKGLQELYRPYLRQKNFKLIVLIFVCVICISILLVASSNWAVFRNLFIKNLQVEVNPKITTGWIRIGAVDKSSGNAIPGEKLVNRKVDVAINPPVVPKARDIVNIASDITLREDAPREPTYELAEKRGYLKPGQQVQILQIYSYIDRRSDTSFLRVWAKVTILE